MNTITCFIPGCSPCPWRPDPGAVRQPEVTERVNRRLADDYDLGLLEEPGLWLSRQS